MIRKLLITFLFKDVIKYLSEEKKTLKSMRHKATREGAPYKAEELKGRIHQLDEVLKKLT